MADVKEAVKPEIEKEEVVEETVYTLDLVALQAAINTQLATLGLSSPNAVLDLVRIKIYYGPVSNMSSHLIELNPSELIADQNNESATGTAIANSVYNKIKFEGTTKPFFPTSSQTSTY